MSAIDDGGSAFPVTAKLMSSEFANIKITETTGGMSLRDWFAGMALQGNLASQSIEVGYYDGIECWKKAASDAYKAADAMLAARKEDNHD